MICSYLPPDSIPYILVQSSHILFLCLSHDVLWFLSKRDWCRVIGKLIGVATLATVLHMRILTLEENAMRGVSNFTQPMPRTVVNNSHTLFCIHFYPHMWLPTSTTLTVSYTSIGIHSVPYTSFVQIMSHHHRCFFTLANTCITLISDSLNCCKRLFIFHVAHL